MRSNLLKALKESFGFKVFATFTLLIFIISFSFTFFFIGHQRDYLRDNLIKKGKLLVEILAYDSRLGVFSENEEMLKVPVEGIFQREGVLEASVFNLEEHLLTRRERSETSIPENSVKGKGASRHEIFEMLMESGSSCCLEGESKAEFWSPVISSSLDSAEDESLFLEGDLFDRRERIIGFVGITVDKGMLNKRLHDLLVKSVLIGIAFLMIGSGVTYLGAKGITRPLNRLTEGVKSLEKGGVAKEVPIETGDEIGRLARAFNDMSKSLRKRERELRESEEKYRYLVENINDVIYALDKRGAITYISPVIEAVLGYQPQEVIGRPFVDSVYEEDLPLIKERFQEVLDGKLGPAEYRLLSKSGEIRWVRSSSRPIVEDNSVVGLRGVLVDITERKQAEIALKRREEELRIITDNIPGLVSYVDANGHYRFVNEQYERWLGIPQKDILGKHYRQLLGDETHELIKKYVEEVLSGKLVHYEEYLPYQYGGKRWVDAEYVPDIDVKGEVKGFFALVTDITERKKAEEALRVSEERYRELANSITDVFFAMDEHLKYVYWNKASEELTGILEKDAIGKSIYEVFPDTPETRKAEKIYFEVLRKKKPRNFVHEYHLGGERFFFDITAYPSGNGLSVFVKDTTEQKKAEEELENSREQLRNLAAHLQSARETERTSIAREIHDELGPALTGLKMDLSWLAEKIPREEPLLEKIQTMINLIDTNINTVRRISAELRPGMLDVLGLVAALEWQAEEFQNRTGVKCKITTDPEEISLDEKLSTDLFRIFQEILTNVARHAQATRVTASFKKKKDYLELKVRDNGRGITGKQISDPTSFGLIGMRERIHPWRGKVTIKGVSNKGTTVTVRAPS